MNSCVPLVSIVVTTHNRPELCKRAVQSAVGQIYRPTELLVVEDGSHSDIEQWLKANAPQGCRYVRNDRNLGLAATRNVGLELANGELIAYLDDDDQWHPERLERQMQLFLKLDKPATARLGVITCGQEIRDPHTTKSLFRAPANVGDLQRAIKREGAKTMPSNCLFPVKVLRDIGGYDTSLQSGIDHDLWMNLAIHGYQCEAVDDPLVIVDIDHSRPSMVGNTEQRVEGVKQYVRKWMPTYRKWFGEAKGQAYGEIYFARVITGLAGSKFASGQWREGIFATNTVFQFCPQRVRSAEMLLRSIAIATACRWIPTWIRRLVRLR